MDGKGIFAQVLDSKRLSCDGYLDGFLWNLGDCPNLGGTV